MKPAVIHVHRGGPVVALVGNPNCGKTALFNLLTGSRQKVANYAGVTVERKEGRLVTPAGRELRLLDLPGAYSLHPRSPDERVTADVLFGRALGEKRPDLVICVVDATNLRRNLRLVLAVRRLGLPCVVALNMADLAARRGLAVDAAQPQQVLAEEIIHRLGNCGFLRRRFFGGLRIAAESAANVQLKSPSARRFRGRHRPRCRGILRLIPA